jgi:HAD superfamily hydrolase (TIGR01548 family)
MIKLESIDGILWDMDGVLVDVSQSYRAAILMTAREFIEAEVNMHDVTKIKHVNGLNNDWDATFALVLLKNGKIDTPDEFVEDLDSYRKKQDYFDIKKKFQELYLGGLIDKESLQIPRTKLEKIKQKYGKMGIVTGRPKAEANYSLEKYEIIDLFDIVIGLEDTQYGKPHPEPLIKAVAELDLEKTVYIGDSPSDANAAKAAGIPCLYLGEQKLGDKQFTEIINLIKFLLK